MKNKIRAVGKLQQVEEQKRDRIGQRLDSMRQQHQHLTHQLELLSHLKSATGQSTLSALTLNSAILMNLNRVDIMLHKMLCHHEQEQAVMEAECNSVQEVLEHKHARVKGLEQVLDRWKKKQSYEKARKEQKHIEDIINSRLRYKTL
ncbi:flagellar export protein FliJ [Vibrio diazotrophicus]|uniref:Flagellar FliJ protein n=1 Tax=Vibrio diazotrophicus TaxID=685 RepID=A0ABX4WFH7_VIBDI|nr:flagellar export protein FliJ [Vibrio diazotrophicus]PNI02110.1 flagellar export protein FliJ [Vibrio diazotrophicus]